MTKLLTTSAIIVAATTSALAQATGPECAKIPDSALRLACYDAAFRAEVTSSAQNAWQVDQEVSKISDVKNVFVTAESQETLPARFGRKDKARIVLRCREKKTEAYINFGGHFMSSLNHGTVTYRVDKRPAKQRRMLESTDHRALGLWSAAEAIAFIRELYDAESLYLQATPHSESPVSADFAIAGLREAIKPLQAACGWSDTPKKPPQ